MMKRRLYNSERPARFSEMVGQLETVHIARTLLGKQQFPQTALFVGAHGTGKTSMARICAKALNCKAPTPDGPCLSCPSCMEAERDANVDIIELDAASRNKVDDVQKLLEQVQFSPVRNSKVFIIDEVHMLSTAAFNALLKTLEEPPKGCYFFLCTTELHKVPATILSRCARFDFRKISGEQIVKHLEHVCQKYEVSYEKDALSLIAKSANGAMRDALGTLEMFMAEEITTSKVQKKLGILKENSIISLIEALLQGNMSATFAIYEGIVETGCSLSLFTQDILQFLGDVMLVKNGCTPDALVQTSYYKEKTATIAKGCSCAQLSQLIDSFQSMVGQADNNLPFLLKSRLLALFSTTSIIGQLETRVLALEQELAEIRTQGIPIPAAKMEATAPSVDLSHTAVAEAPEQTAPVSLLANEREEETESVFAPAAKTLESMPETSSLTEDEAIMRDFHVATSLDEAILASMVPSEEPAATVEPLPESTNTGTQELLPPEIRVEGTISFADFAKANKTEESPIEPAEPTEESTPEEEPESVKPTETDTNSSFLQQMDNFGFGDLARQFGITL